MPKYKIEVRIKRSSTKQHPTIEAKNMAEALQKIKKDYPNAKWIGNIRPVEN